MLENASEEVANGSATFVLEFRVGTDVFSMCCCKNSHAQSFAYISLRYVLMVALTLDTYLTVFRS